MGCDSPADSNDREQELAYLRVLMPEELLPHALVEVPGKENIAILCLGAEQHLGLRLYPGQHADLNLEALSKPDPQSAHPTASY